MNNKFDTKSTQFKRALHALSYALSISQDIEDEDEKELFLEILDEIGFIGSEDALLEYINNKFEDYDDYSQLQRGHFTGIWFQQMQKEDGKIFLREVIGNELNMPRAISSFADITEGKILGEYTAKQVSCFFIPFNTPISGNEFRCDETNHTPFSLKDIQVGGAHNQVAVNALNYAKKLHVASNKETQN